MANATYPRFKQAALSPGVNLATAAVNVILVDAGAYTYAPTHEFLTSVPAGARAGTPQTLASKTFTNGVLDAADITFPEVPAGPSLEAMIIYIATGSEGTSRLIAYIDDVEGLPITPNGGDLDVEWAANGIVIL